MMEHGLRPDGAARDPDDETSEYPSREDRHGHLVRLPGREAELGADVGKDEGEKGHLRRLLAMVTQVTMRRKGW